MEGEMASSDLDGGVTSMPDRILFLDFDGVLNHTEHFASLPPDRTAADVDVDCESFDLACIARLNAIVDRTGCKVVISSTWRHEYTRSDLQGHLVRHGYAGKVHGVTPVLPGKPRGAEIAAWLSERPAIEFFVILDDNSDMGPLRGRLVQTSFATGLQDEHVEAVVRMLTREEQE
jgi:hypothetical protein